MITPYTITGHKVYLTNNYLGYIASKPNQEIKTTETSNSSTPIAKKANTLGILTLHKKG